MWRLPGCGGSWAVFSSGAVEAHLTLQYLKIKGDKLYVEAPWLWRPLGSLQYWSCGGPTYPTIPKNERWQNICGGPLVVEAPGQLSSLPSPKSSPVESPQNILNIYIYALRLRVNWTPTQPFRTVCVVRLWTFLRVIIQTSSGTWKGIFVTTLIAAYKALLWKIRDIHSINITAVYA